MTDGILATSFVYTAAPFGHDGINGFQFVGLPAGGAAPELIDAVAKHVRYTAPLGVPSQPTDEDIARHFPVSTRIVHGAFGSQTLLIQSRYIGQVYQSDGKRGKWGNFIAHARVIPANSATGEAMIGIARTATWRHGLSKEELDAGKPLDLPEERLAPTLAPNTTLLDERDRAAGLAAILARLDGDLPLLLPNTEPEQALAIFHDLAAHLPDVLSRRLSWSTFEFDAGPGYDVLATIGDTRLAADSGAYLRLDAPPDEPVYLWAGQTICRDGAAFWTRIALFSDLSEPTRLADVLAQVRRIDEAGPDALDPVHEALALLRKSPADPLRIAAAEAIFARSFGGLRDAEADNFALLVSAGKEALALASWSSSDRVWQDLVEWAEVFPSIDAALEPSGEPGPLSKAIARAVSAGSDVDHVLDMTLAIAFGRLSRGANTTAMATAILAILPDSGQGAKAARHILRLAKHHLNSPAYETLVEDLLARSSEAAGLDWLNLVTAELPSIAPALANRVLPKLEIRILEALADTPSEIAEVARRVLGLASLPRDSSRSERIKGLLERIDAALPMTGRKQAKIAADLAAAAKAHKLDPGVTPNALALQVTASESDLVAILKDSMLLERIQHATAPDVYIAFFDHAFAVQVQASMLGSAKYIKALWRSDIRDHFANHTARHFLDGTNRTLMIDRVEDAIVAQRANTRGSQRDDDWSVICENVGLQLCTKLDQYSFDVLVRDYPTSTLVAAMVRRRNRSFATIARSAGNVIRHLLSRHRRD